MTSRTGEATASSGEQPAALRGQWLWLFPASYAVHVAEEGLAGEGFYRWIRRVIGRELSPAAFAALNLALGAAMAAAIRRAQQHDDALWVVPALGTITTMNGAGHLAGSLATRSYSPGAVSGLTLWVPLGLHALARSRRLLPRSDWRRGVAAGVLAMGGVALLVLPLSRKPGTAGSAATCPAGGR